MHDPTTLNQQGNDRGTQYRSAIFYHDQEQYNVAVNATKRAQEFYKSKIQTLIEEFKNYCPAESYHHVQNLFI